MRTPRFPLLILGIFSLASSTGCTSLWRREVIAGREPVFVYRESRVEDDATVPFGFDHPASVSADEWLLVLANLSYHDRPLLGSTEIEPVFTPTEAPRLARALSRALEEVGPDERVRFLVVRTGLETVLLGLSGVSGVAFVDEGRLHVAFDTIDGGIYEGSTGRAEDVRFPYDPVEETYEHGLVPPWPWTRIHRDARTGEEHKRWLEIDLAALAKAVEEVDAEAVASDVATASSGARETETPATGDDEAPSPAPENSIDRIGEKLRALKELRERGDLTEEEYRAAVEKVLDSL